jgi:hypothetical protein
MKNDSQAALDLFSNYSAFMLTDDELLVIHGGATNTGGGASGGGSPGGSTTAPPAAPPAAPPPVPPAPIEPVSLTLTGDLTPAITDAEHTLAHSQTADALDTFYSHVVHAVDNFFFGPSAPTPPPSTGGAGGSEGSGGTGG